MGVLEDALSTSTYNDGVASHLRVHVEKASEEAFMWVMTAPLLLFKDSVLFSTESDNLIKNPTII
jgi:hypothetical protein